MTAIASDVPLLSIKAQNAALAGELKEAVNRVLDSGAFVLGPENKAFDLEFAAAVGAPFCLGVDSGTSALELSLEAVGVGPGDEVIVPSFTFIATATAVSVLGATPVFADVDDATLTLDPRSVEKLITPKTKAIVPVHLFGQPADMDPLLSIAKNRGLFIVEDCAQSHLATYKGRTTGTFGAAAAFSFYPTKNLGAAGDAGAITTADPALRDRILELRNCGRTIGAAYHHARIGHNCRMDDIQAAVLRVKLRRLKDWTEARRRVARLYHAGLADLPLRLPPLGGAGTEPVFHLFTVRLENRDALAAHLKTNGIGCGVYYPIPVHLQPAYAGHPARVPLPVSDRASREALSLPMFAELPESDVARVCGAVRGFFPVNGRVARILFVSTSTTVGGAEKTLFALATLLDHRRHQVLGVVSLKPEGHYARRLGEQGVRIETLGLARAPRPADAKRLAAIIDRERPDVVHAVMYQAIQLARMAKPLAGVPFKLVTSPRVNYRSRSLWTLLVDRWLKERDDLLIAESESSRGFLLKKLGYKPAKVITIRNGVDLAGWSPSKIDRQKRRLELRLGGGDVLVGAIGRLDRQKGFSTLIAAMALLKKTPLRCVILGDGPERARLEAQIRAHHLESAVWLPGEKDEVPSWLSAFDLYCLPSLWEGLPNSLLEAMALGLPVVASDVDGVPEAVSSGKTGLLVPPAKPAALAAALQALADDPERRAALGAAAKTAVSTRFTLRRMIGEYERVYDELLAR